MIQTLLLFSLTSVWTSAVRAAPTVYQAEEDDSITITWDSPVHTDLSHSNMICWFLSDPVKVLYEMIKGVEVPEPQHQQFAGRAQMDTDALREGRIRLHLSRLRTEDSGLYVCDVRTASGFGSSSCELTVSAAAAQTHPDRPALSPALSPPADTGGRTADTVGLIAAVVILGINLVRVALCIVHCQQDQNRQSIRGLSVQSLRVV
ncbi:uncharacterized protein LOC114435282 [Parambassis ranga]|uniref:Uncharacterized protein LOC114435282 n=1 Tax=Parambassis ranga TaxID=210632 RepID=A0A6P7I7R7_9TELE|nr:uncharacterized protein LOC114435282 [Parambassis ranga]